jgi:hypothetical protein
LQNLRKVLGLLCNLIFQRESHSTPGGNQDESIETI